VGNGVLRAGATEALRRLVRSTGLGVANTFMAKGAVPRSWDQALLTTGIGDPDPAAELLRQADLVLAIGYDLVETDPEGLTPRDGVVVHLAATETETDANYQPALQGVGCLRTTLQALADRAAVARLDLSRPEHLDVRARRLAELEVQPAGDAPLPPPEVLATLRAELKARDIVLSDVGEHKMQIARLYPCDEPDTCLISNGYASMGFALPGALAARLVHPDPDERKVVAVVGDGGLLMNVQEMETAVRLGLPVVVMVWVDGGYGLIEHKQQAEHGRHTDLSFGNPDFVQLARSFGWHAEHVDHSRTLRPALQRALRCDRPALVVVPIDYSET
jgi:acetolactate synthase-1/2/3 large subunit